MLIRLVFVVAETFGTWRSARDWAGYAAQVALTSFVVSVMCGLVETASGLGGDVGASLRSFTTRAYSLRRSARRSSRGARPDQRTQPCAMVGRCGRHPVWAGPWRASSSWRRPSPSAVSRPSSAWLALTLRSRASGPSYWAPPRSPCGFGAPTWVAASVIVGATLVPSAVDAIRRPVEAGPSRGHPSRTVALSVAAMTWTAPPPGSHSCRSAPCGRSSSESPSRSCRSHSPSSSRQRS